MANADLVPAVVRATPLVGLGALDLGPFLASDSAPWLGFSSAGVIGRKLVVLAHIFSGLTAEERRWQTAGAADPGLVEAELARMVDAGLLTVTPDGTAHLGAGTAPHVAMASVSLADVQAVTSDDLQVVCRRLGIATPARKQERIDAIAAHFAHPDTAELARKELSVTARNLLHRLVAAAGPGAVTTFQVGVSDQHLYQVGSRYRGAGGPPNPLRDLVELGFVGVNQWERTVWVWREAMPALDVPLFDDWSAAPRPEPVTAPTPPAQVPEIVSVLDRALRQWAQSPPPTLKNGDNRLGKAVVTATAKALGVDAATVDLAGRLALDLELLLANTVAVTGRGRNRRAQQVWLADPILAEAWDRTPPVDRWARLVAAWCRPESRGDHRQLQCNRHLALWELASLEPGLGYPDDEAFARWLADCHASLGHPDAATDAVAEIRALGLAPAAGPLALTGLARHLLDDPATVAEALDQAGTSVIVQGDLTILVPPGTDAAIRHQLADLATVESDGAAQVLRLDEARITRAVQAGATAEGIVAFLREVSSVPLVDAVTRLVADAAARSQRVSLLAATTVVVVTDPADLTLACSVKAAKLQAVSDTVALSPLPVEKVRAALDRKGLAPALAANPAAALAPRSASSDDTIEHLRHQAEVARSLARKSPNRLMDQHAERLEKMAERLADPRARLAVSGPLTLTPARAVALFEKKGRG